MAGCCDYSPTPRSSTRSARPAESESSACAPKSIATRRHTIPAYLAEVGYELVPVPYKPIAMPTILGFPVCPLLREAHDLDILNIFLRPERVSPFLDDILHIRPKVVWFQSGLLHLPSADAIAAAGLGVVRDCIGCRRAAIAPACLPLEGQGGPAGS